MCFIYVLLFIPYVVFMYFAIPIVAGIAAAIYTVAIPVCYATSLVKVLLLRSPGITYPPYFPQRPDPGEPAEIGYFYGFRSPAFAEIRQVATVAYKQAIDVSKRGREILKAGFTGVLPNGKVPLGGRGKIVTVPLTIGAAAGMGVGLAFGAIAFAAIAAVHIVIAAVVFACIATVGQALKLIDTGLLRLRHIRMTCPNCFERVVPYPIYKCNGEHSAKCGKMHLDIRPGRYGIFRRRCVCGSHFPTLMLFHLASSDRLTAHCPHEGCRKPLEHRPGEAQEIVLPFFGAAGAGKTRLMYGIVTLFRSAPGLRAEFADKATESELEDVKALLAPGEKPKKTARTLPRGQIMRIKSKGGTRLLQLYDTAGERFYKTAEAEELRFLNKASTFVLVIDPLSIDPLWESLTSERQAALSGIRSGKDTPAPDLAYHQTQQQMEAMGVKLKKARLAVVFSRADVIDEYDSPAAEDWAADALGLGNLVRSAKLEFGQVGFFRTASVLSPEGELHPSVAQLTRWLVAGDGITLPENQNWMVTA